MIVYSSELLKDAERGVYNPGSRTIAVGNGSQKWDLDMLGNWVTFKHDLDGSGAYSTSETQARTHNMANELETSDRDAPGGTQFAYRSRTPPQTSRSVPELR